MGLISDIFIFLVSCIPYCFGILVLVLAIYIAVSSIAEFIDDIRFNLSVIWLAILWLIVKLIFAIIVGCCGMTFIS